MISVRLAGENDHTAVAEISKHYDSNLIHLVYNRWQQQGSLYLAEVEGRAVGFCGLVFPASTEAQILGIRLLPEFQKEAIGRDFIIALMQVAQENGCNVVRMLTASENYETQAAMQRNLNFGRCGTWMISHGENLEGLTCCQEGMLAAAPEMLEDIWNYLQYSPAYIHSQGLIYTDLYTFRSFSKIYLSQQLAAGQVFARREGGTLTGVAVAETAEDTIILRYLDAKPHGIKELLLGVFCCHQGSKLTAAMPIDTYVVAKPFLEEIVVSHRPDQWLVMAKEVSPLAFPRD